VPNDLVGGRYRLEQRLGLGGMSEVWAAEDTELGRRVAIKLLGHDADAARFNREARAVAALAHPNICQLYDFGEEAGRPFMVLEYLGGGTLEDRLVTGEPYPDEETARVAAELAAALAHAHARGLVHRDLKPANVLFDEEGRPKIADFGIARLSGAGTLTEAGTLLGTAAYISPEQATGQQATPASDVYSFGVILYRLLAGRLPFEASSALELAEMHVRDAPPPLRALRPDAPPDLADVAEAALAKSPDDRPPDGGTLAALLGDAQTATAPTVVATRGGSDSGTQPTTHRRSTHRATTRRTTTAASTSRSTPTTTAQTTTRATTTRPATTAAPPPPPPPPTPPPTTTPPTPPPPPTTAPTVTVPTTVTTPTTPTTP
jgi:serine/threonine-protein kinase